MARAPTALMNSMVSATIYREAGIDVGEGRLDQAQGCARKVFALEPVSASGLQLRGWIHYCRGRIQDAVHDLKAALEIEPHNADTLLAGQIRRERWHGQSLIVAGQA